MRKETGAGVLAALLTVTPVVAGANEAAVNPLITPDPIIEKGEMPSQEGEIDLIGQKEVELVNQRFSQFLAGEGEFDEERINQTLMKNSSIGFRDLGYFFSNGKYYFSIQATLLHCEDGENSQYLALGIKDRNGDRVIKGVEWPTAWLVKPGVERCYVFFRKGLNYKSDYDGLLFENENEAKEYTRGLVGKRLLVSLLYDDYNKKSDQNEEILSYFDYLNSKNLINVNFAADLLFPEKKDLMEPDKDLFEKIKKIKTKSKNITSLNEMRTMIDNNEDFPVTYAFEYNLDEK